MEKTLIRVENLSKQYRLGKVGTGTLTHDLRRWWHLFRGKDDPFLKIGEANNVSTVADDSQYVWALKDINFEVNQGDVLGIIGKNGAGKSTLLKILSHITSPTTGQVKIKGKVASLLEVGTGFHPELSGRENIFLNGAILGMTKQDVAKRFDEIVAFSGVERYIDTPVKRYSSGMYVRLAFAVAAYLEPDILIVDEVLAVGDADFQKKCMGKMGAIASEEGRTVLFVSHNLGAISNLCTKGIVLQNGSCAFKGGVKDCVDFYLSNTSTQLSTKYTPTTPKNNEAFISAISLQANSSYDHALFDVHTQLTLHISLTVLKEIKGTTPYYDLKLNQEVIYRSFASDCSAEILESIQPGIYHFETAIHTPLKKGLYAIDVRIIKIGDKFYDEVEDSISFEIDELKQDLMFKSYWHKRPGIIGTNHQWQVQKQLS